MTDKTAVTIEGDKFLLNGELTYQGRDWKGRKIEGLLLNTRMAQGVFDDVNPETVDQWAYPDTGKWDPDRNTTEFIENMPDWKAHGILAFTLNLQGGSPYGYSVEQAWINSAINSDGSLDDAFMARTKRILDAADELGMVVILGLYYFGQEKHMNDDDAVRAGVVNTMQWVLDGGYRNVLIEINNECNVRYTMQPLVPQNVHELIDLAKSVTKDGRRLLVGTSYGRRNIPSEKVTRASDFMLIHGNHEPNPDNIRKMVRDTRAVKGYSPKPILFNEDDHFDFDKPDNNFIAALDEYASWGYFDYRFEGEGPDEGYQSLPVNWTMSSERKKGFFKLAKEISGI